ncbi:hypothetical protein ACFYSJ_28615 [Streptomyces sp. NPDC005248]
MTRHTEPCGDRSCVCYCFSAAHLCGCDCGHARECDCLEEDE